MKVAKYEADMDALQLMYVDMRLVIEVSLPNNKKLKTTSRLIGYKKDAFILIDYPAGLDTGFGNPFLENANIIVRAITDSGFRDIIAFKTKINTMITRPARMISLDMPENIVTHKIREAPRLGTEYTVDIACNGKQCPAKMVDFSISGCGLALENQNVNILKDSKIKINLFASDSIKAVLDGQVVSVKTDSGAVNVGVKFNQSQLELTKDIYHSIIIEMSMNEALSSK